MKNPFLIPNHERDSHILSLQLFKLQQNDRFSLQRAVKVQETQIYQLFVYPSASRTQVWTKVRHKSKNSKVQRFIGTESRQTNKDLVASTHRALKWTEPSQEGVQASGRPTGSEQKQSAEAEGGSGYRGRDVENRSEPGRVEAESSVWGEGWRALHAGKDSLAGGECGGAGYKQACF